LSPSISAVLVTSFVIVIQTEPRHQRYLKPNPGLRWTLHLFQSFLEFLKVLNLEHASSHTCNPTYIPHFTIMAPGGPPGAAGRGRGGKFKKFTRGGKFTIFLILDLPVY
jgi:hypothetical protein